VFVEGLSEKDQITIDIQGLVSIKGFNQSGIRYKFLGDCDNAFEQRSDVLGATFLI